MSPRRSPRCAGMVGRCRAWGEDEERPVKEFPGPLLFFSEFLSLWLFRDGLVWRQGQGAAEV